MYYILHDGEYQTAEDENEKDQVVQNIINYDDAEEDDISVFHSDDELDIKAPIVDKRGFLAACRCLIDNGVSIDEAQTVMQAICYIMHDTETEQFMSEEIEHCVNCKHFGKTCNDAYQICDIHTMAKFETWRVKT